MAGGFVTVGSLGDLRCARPVVGCLAETHGDAAHLTVYGTGGSGTAVAEHPPRAHDEPAPVAPAPPRVPPYPNPTPEPMAGPTIFPEGAPVAPALPDAPS